MPSTSIANVPSQCLRYTAMIKRNPKNRPVLAAMNVARRKFFATPQTMARKTRPPSNGNPGIRLNSPSMPLMSARYLATASCRREAHKQRLREENQRRQCKASERPDTAIRNSALALRGFTFNLGYATKDEQGDSAKRYLVADGDPRMGPARAQRCWQKTKLLSQHPSTSIRRSCHP